MVTTAASSSICVVDDTTIAGSIAEVVFDGSASAVAIVVVMVVAAAADAICRVSVRIGVVEEVLLLLLLLLLLDLSLQLGVGHLVLGKLFLPDVFRRSSVSRATKDLETSEIPYLKKTLLSRKALCLLFFPLVVTSSWSFISDSISSFLLLFHNAFPSSIITLSLCLRRSSTEFLSTMSRYDRLSPSIAASVLKTQSEKVQKKSKRENMREKFFQNEYG